MTTLLPCIGCIARNDCDIKRAAIKALRGVPITSAKIRCRLPFTRDFPPGTRVSVTVWDYRDFSGDGGGVLPKLVPATVVGPSSKKSGKLLMHLDDPVMMSAETAIEFRAAWPKDVIKLDEPRRDFCASCERAFVKNKCSCPDLYPGEY